ncbi:MAG: 3-deoxy-D-manno-octulosonic acid transferase [Leptospira sp.]|nr:3-deoxy-D-manno-octulosonic acid transferase [Leptospira sp.]
MYFLYTLLVYVIYFFVSILINFFPKYKKIQSERTRLLKEVLSKNAEGREVIWLHSASVGELDQSKALIAIIKKKNPKSFILQSVFSASVTEKQLIDPQIDAYFYLPFDIPNFYKPILKKFKPKKLIILAWDTWPNLLKTCSEFGVKTFLVCAALSPNSSRKNSFLKKLTKESFSYLNGLYPTHPFSEKEFRDLVSDSTDFQVLGDSRFDSVLIKLKTKKPKESFLKYIQKTESHWKKKPPYIFGSTYSICESYILDWISQTESKQALWIFPHKWEEERGNQLVKSLGKFMETKRFSEISVSGKTPDCIVFDELGILAFAYKYGRLAYVGGGFHHRIHNTIEPAAFGLPLLTGPKIDNAPEALVMQSLGGLKRVYNSEEFVTTLRTIETDKKEFKRIGQINRNFVVENSGASEKIYNRVFLNDKT